jgi:hypothetical protein
MKTSAARRLARSAVPQVLGPPPRSRPPLRLVPAWVDARQAGRGYWVALRGVDALGLLTGGIIGFFWHPPAALLAMLVAVLISRADAAPRL